MAWGGDYSGARRSRRAFRWCVFACLSFVVTLWFFDVQYRYELNEQQYLKSLTHHPSSARAFLRKVVKTDAERSETPNPKYLEALAFIEEDDLVLPTYEKAYELAPDKPSLVINYGCRLYQAGQFNDARLRFREARSYSPENALPHYLQIAAMVATLEDDADLSEVFGMLTQVNIADTTIQFPEPLWHPSLPKSGQWYNNLQERINDLCLEPLYRMHKKLTELATEDIKNGDYEEWDNRLRIINSMGERLIQFNDSEVEIPSLSRASAGIKFQLDAITAQRLLKEKRGEEVATPLIERQLLLQQASLSIGEFRDKRFAQQQENRNILRMPLELGFSTVGLFFLVYIFMFLLVEFVHGTRNAWAVAHSVWAKAVLLLGPLVFWLILLLALINANSNSGIPTWLSSLPQVWGGISLFLVAMGLLYPFIALPSARRVLKGKGFEGDPENDGPIVRRYRRIAIIVHWRRYFGILLGAIIIAMCAWMLFGRMLLGVYPYQLALLVQGYEADVADLIAQVQDKLK